MSRSLARRGLSALLTLACAAAAFLVALDAPAPTRAPAFALTGAGGALTLANDRQGAAILQAGDLRPGDVAEGVVTLSADRDVALSLRSQPGVELAGAGGGMLSDRIALAIDDVTDPGAPAAVYSGPLAQLPELALAGLAGGEQRRYRFRAMFPAGAGDNAYQGASLTTAFEWTAVAPTPAPPDPDPPAQDPPASAPPVGGAPARPTPAAPAAARLGGLPAARGCVKRRRYRVTAKPAAGVRVKSITVFLDNRRARGTGRKGRKARVDLRARQARQGRGPRGDRHDRRAGHGRRDVPPLRQAARPLSALSASAA